MPRDSAKGRERALKNRAIRQDEMRRQLAAKGLESHVLKMVRELRTSDDIDSLKVARYRAAIDGSMRLIDKYLPSLKAIEHTGDQTTDLSGLLRELTDWQRSQTEYKRAGIGEELAQPALESKQEMPQQAPVSPVKPTEH